MGGAGGVTARRRRGCCSATAAGRSRLAGSMGLSVVANSSVPAAWPRSVSEQRAVDRHRLRAARGQTPRQRRNVDRHGADSPRWASLSAVANVFDQLIRTQQAAAEGPQAQRDPCRHLRGDLPPIGPANYAVSSARSLRFPSCRYFTDVNRIVFNRAFAVAGFRRSTVTSLA